MGKRRKIKAIVALVIATTLYGFEWLFVGRLDRMRLNPLAITFGIVFFAWLGLIVLTSVNKVKLMPADKNDLSRLVWLGLCYLLNAALFFAALAKGQVAPVLLLNFLAPVWTVLLARIFLGENFTRKKLFSLCLAVLGLIVAFNLRGGSTGFVVANLLALLAGWFGAGRTIISSKINFLSPYVRSYWMFLVASLVLLVINIFYPPVFSVDWFLAIVYLLILGIGIQMTSMLLVQYALNHLEASVVGILLLLEIAAGVITAWLIGGQVPSAGLLIGGGLIILSCINILHKEANSDRTDN